MYLTHHYLIDVVGGGCLVTALFYFFLTDDMKGAGAHTPPPNLTTLSGRARSKYELYDIEVPSRGGMMLSVQEFDAASEPSSDDEEIDSTYRSPLPNTTSFPTTIDESGYGSHSNSMAHSHSQTQTHPHNANNGHSAKPAMGGGARGCGHRHTASIASLIRGKRTGGWLEPLAASFGFSTNGSSDVGGGRVRTDWVCWGYSVIIPFIDITVMPHRHVNVASRKRGGVIHFVFSFTVTTFLSLFQFCTSGHVHSLREFILPVLHLGTNP